MKKYIWVAFAIVFISLFIYWVYNLPNEEVLSTPDEVYLVIGDNSFNDSTLAILEENLIYLSLDIIKEYIDPNIFYDENEQMIIITNDKEVARYVVNENCASVNHREFYLDNPVKEVESSIYIPDDILTRHYDLNIAYWENTNTITVDDLNSNYILGQVILEGGDIRVSFDKKAPIIFKDVPVETELYVFEEYEDWYKVRTIDGIVGYINKEYMKIDLASNIHSSGEYDKISKVKRDKINLTWDYTHRKMENVENVEYIEGVNVISPTWFSIVDENGNIMDKGNREYVVKYKELGYEIWPLINNNFDPDLTRALLSSSESRERLIENIARIYISYGVDGINLDFENIYMNDRDLLTQFVRELYPVFKEKGMTVTMDVTPISVSENWSRCYDRRRLSETLDYIMLMAYDQHWASSPVAGSVAQYSWVEDSVRNVLEEVPNEKLILGVPFYTRLWTVKNTEEGDKVSSQVLSMDEAKKFIEGNNIELIWDDESGQYFGEVTKDGITYKIWMEDEKSLQMKSSLINKYDLAGIASWRKGFEKEEVWPVLSNSIYFN